MAVGPYIGKIIAGFIAIISIGAVALLSGILAGEFSEKLRERRRKERWGIEERQRSGSVQIT